MAGHLEDEQGAGVTAGSADPLEGLNDRQREAATHDEGPLIVLAGPGTGKTRVIVSRIAYMIAERGVEPDSVLALTFTNKAAGEMRDRLARVLGAVTAERVNAFTFNGFGAHILRRFGDVAGLPPDPGLIDSAQRKRMLRRVVDERGLFRHAVVSGLETAILNAQRLIDAMHCAGFTVQTARARLDEVFVDISDRLAGSPSAELAESLRAREREVGVLRETVELWEGFDAACLAEGVMSFDHQVSWTNRLLESSAMARDVVHADYRHVVVDEYQDVNASQIALLRLIAPPERNHGAGPDLCVVGDDDQAIYGFRGSDDRAFARFEQIWPTAQTVMLEENYRSASCVLARAGAVIGAAHERFRPDKIIRRAESAGDEPAGACVEAIRLENYQQADEVIAAMIAESVRTRPEVPLSEYAVIVRLGKEGDRIRRSLELEGLRVQSGRAVAPTTDDGVLDVLAWIDVLLNPRNTWSARRVMLRPPFQMDVELVTSMERRYTVIRSDALYRKRRGGEAVEPAGFFEWAKGLLDSNRAEQEIGAAIPAHQASVLGRVLSLHGALEGPAQTASASAVIGEIIRRTDVVHSEMLDGRARAARVAAVVGIIRFAAERADRLEEPGDLRAFMDYYKDLDSKEQTLREPTVSHEADSESREVDPAAVQVLTAHGAKGLEFDTVFLPRVETQHGYPLGNRPEDGERLPGWMQPGDDRDEVERQDDEERRLFYVACTRAKRRLVLLGRVPKNKPARVNYFYELLDEPLGAVVRAAAEVLGPHGRDGADREAGSLRWDDQAVRREAVRAARRVARLRAAAALEDAATAAERKSYDEVCERLASCARRLAVVGAAEAGRPIPAWIEDAELRGLHATLLSDDPEYATAAEVSIRPMPAPLTLSYTSIRSWHECPRCFYVGQGLGLPDAETTQIVTGKVVHKALEEFYMPCARARQAGEEPPARCLDDLLALGEAAFEAERRSGMMPGEDQREQIREMLGQYYENLHVHSADAAYVEHTFRFVYEHRGAHVIKGKIDRIDFDGSGYKIIDYKTGYPKQSLLTPEGKDKQLGVYLMALRAWLNGGSLKDAPLPVGKAAYWVLSTGERGEVSFDDIDEAEAKTRKWIEKAIDGMLDGDFEQSRSCSGLCTFLDPGCSAGW